MKEDEEKIENDRKKSKKEIEKIENDREKSHEEIEKNFEKNRWKKNEEKNLKEEKRRKKLEEKNQKKNRIEKGTKGRKGQQKRQNQNKWLEKSTKQIDFWIRTAQTRIRRAGLLKASILFVFNIKMQTPLPKMVLTLFVCIYAGNSISLWSFICFGYLWIYFIIPSVHAFVWETKTTPNLIRMRTPISHNDTVQFGL